MTLKKLILGVTLNIILFLPFLSTAEESNQYKVASGDIISITVLEEPDLSINNVKINSNGTVLLPLLGHVIIKGMSVNEVQNKITELLLKDYLKHPTVTVSIGTYRPFYINGEVKNPGSYPYRLGLTIEMAITIAGGLTDRASENTIILTHKDENTAQSVNFKSKVAPGDVISVKESFF